MAGLQERKRNGKIAYQIQFTDDKGRRKTLYLGNKYDRQTAEEVRQIVERVVDAIATERAIDRRTEAWLANMPDDMRERFIASGLIEEERQTTIEELFNAYFRAELDALKDATRSSKLSAYRRLLSFFDGSLPAEELTKRDVQNFIVDLDKRYKEATRAGTIRDVRRVYNWGLENGVIKTNPFNGVARGSFKNKQREYFISRTDYQALLDACPNATFRALIALYRIGGLRKEEALRVQWQDVDFVGGRLLVHSPKTERYKGRESRVIPLFPELRSELEPLWEQTPEGAPPFVISQNRTTVFKHIERIVFFAGLTRWERLIQNMRSSRAIEVFNAFGELAESEWIGHSSKTAREHYLHVLDETFRQATLEDSENCEVVASTKKLVAF